MKKFVALTVLCISLFGFYSCLEDNDPIWYIYEEPAWVLSNEEGENMIIKTAYGRFNVAKSANSNLDTIKVGEYLWVNFIVDFGDQPLPNDTLVTSFNAKKINTSILKMQETGQIDDEYADTIALSTLYRSNIGKMLFFKFDHRAHRGQEFEYEIICHTDSLPEDRDDFPNLYIRAKKKNNAALGEVVEVSQHYGFDMSPFVSEYKNGNNEVKLYLHYKNRTAGENGEEDIYRSFQTYPVTWKVPE